MFKFISLLLFSVSLSAHAMSIEDELAQIKYFSIGYNGFVPKKSEGERLYEKIMSSTHREDIFLRVIQSEKATKESKLYAACGLWLINKKRLGEINPAQGYVTILQGDILQKRKFGEIFSIIKRKGCY